MTPREGALRYRFGSFELDPSVHELRSAGRRVPLQGKPYAVLLALVSRAPRLVTREELHRELWGEGVFVDAEHGLNTAVRKLREALGDDAQAPRYVETVARHGYRFTAPVETLPPGADGEEPKPARAAAGTGVAVPVAAGDGASAGARLRNAGIAVLAMVLLAVAALAFRFTGREGPGGVESAPEVRSIAVLPLLNHSGDPEREYFADGMTEALIAELAQVGAWRVTSRTSSMAFKGRERRLPEIARELDVDAVIEGSVVHTGERVRVTVQLLDARADRHLWAESFERPAADVLLLQAEIAAAAARQVSVRLRARSGDTTARAVDPVAYDAYLRGRYFWNRRTPEGFRKALAEFDRVTTIAPGWAPGWAALAGTYGLVAISGYDLMPPSEAMPRARDAARRALDLDDTLAEAHAAIAWVSFTYDWNFAVAEREFRRAIELDPSYATAHQWYSNLLCASGRLEEAQAAIAKALALDPLSLVINNEAAWPDYYARRYDQSDARYLRTLDLDPDYPTAHLELGMNHAVRGRWAEAITAYERYREASGDTAQATAFIAHAEASRGNRARALALRDELLARSATAYVPSYALAVAELGLGDHARALDALERALAGREDALLYVGVDPLFDPLRREPRFVELLRRIHAGGPARTARPRPAS